MPPSATALEVSLKGTRLLALMHLIAKLVMVPTLARRVGVDFGSVRSVSSVTIPDRSRKYFKN